MSIMGIPADSIVTVKKFFTCRVRSLSMSGFSVAAVLAVRLVVFALVGDEIVEGEAVMTRHEVDALLGLALFVAVQRRAADQAVRKALDHAFFATEKTTDVIAEPPVPLPPAVSDEAPHLVQARRIPGLGDELRASERRVRLDIQEHRRAQHHMT